MIERGQPRGLTGLLQSIQWTALYGAAALAGWGGGYLSEHHSFGETEDAAGEYAEELAAEMLATTLNVEFDPDRSWDEKKQIYRLSNKIVRTANVTQSAVGDKRGLWTTVIASAVLIFD